MLNIKIQDIPNKRVARTLLALDNLQTQNQVEELSDEELMEVTGGVTIEASVSEDSLTPVYAPFFGVMGSASAMVFSALGAAYGTAKSGTV